MHHFFLQVAVSAIIKVYIHISICICNFVSLQVAVSALLGDTPKIVEYGTALMSNLATKEVPVFSLLLC